MAYSPSGCMRAYVLRRARTRLFVSILFVDSIDKPERPYTDRACLGLEICAGKAELSVVIPSPCIDRWSIDDELSVRVSFTVDSLAEILLPDFHSLLKKDDRVLRSNLNLLHLRRAPEKERKKRQPQQRQEQEGRYTG